MNIKIERIYENYLITTKEVGGKKFYCLPELLEQLKIKSAYGAFGENLPLQVNAELVWDYRVVGTNFIEAPFVDSKYTRKLILSYRN